LAPARQPDPRHLTPCRSLRRLRRAALRAEGAAAAAGQARVHAAAAPAAPGAAGGRGGRPRQRSRARPRCGPDHAAPDLRTHLLNAFAELLARLHLGGFFWGDCSLSNTLFRRDAGALSAYLVDAETGELHAELSDGQ